MGEHYYKSPNLRHANSRTLQHWVPVRIKFKQMQQDSFNPSDSIYIFWPAPRQCALVSYFHFIIKN